MRTKLALFLLSGVLVYGCVRLAENAQTPRRSQFVTTLASIGLVQDTSSKSADRRVTVHDVELTGYCPDDVLINGRDIVRFVNRSGVPVRITGLSTKGTKVGSGNPTDVSLSDVNQLELAQTNGHGQLRTIGLIEVNPNPFKGQYLKFNYGVLYRGEPCADDPGAEQHFWSVPPTMIVGPDTL